MRLTDYVLIGRGLRLGSTSALPGKIFKAQKHIKIDATLRSRFFRKTGSVTVPCFGFFPKDSRIRVKLHCSFTGVQLGLEGSVFHGSYWHMKN